MRNIDARLRKLEDSTEVNKPLMPIHELERRVKFLLQHPEVAPDLLTPEAYARIKEILANCEQRMLAAKRIQK